MNHPRRILQTSAPWLALVAAVIVHWLYAQPGYMSFDSVWQYRDAQAGTYTDWHPPMMAFLWHFVDQLSHGPRGMLLLQDTLFLVGCFVVVRLFARPMYAAAAAGTTLLYPPIATVLAVIWKDSLMTGAAMLGVAFLLSGSRTKKVIALVLFTVAAAVRYNGFTVTLAPMILLFEWRTGSAWIRRYALSTALWLVTALVAQLANSQLTTTKQYPWHGSVAMFDIVGVLRFAPEMPDDIARDYLAGTPLGATDHIQDHARAAYSAPDGVFRVLGAGFMQQPKTEAEREAIARSWRHLVRDHPVAYLAHRWQAYRSLLGLAGPLQQGIWVGIDRYGLDIAEYAPSSAQRFLQKLAAKAGRTWIMRPYTYLGIVVCLTILAVVWRVRVAWTLGLSALISEAALFVASPTPDFRYSIWLVACAFVMFWILFAVRYAQGRAPPVRMATPDVPPDAPARAL